MYLFKYSKFIGFYLIYKTFIDKNINSIQKQKFTCLIAFLFSC
jgi:hypothetical protein